MNRVINFWLLKAVKTISSALWQGLWTAIGFIIIMRLMGVSLA